MCKSNQILETLHIMNINVHYSRPRLFLSFFLGHVQCAQQIYRINWKFIDANFSAGHFAAQLSARKKFINEWFSFFFSFHRRSLIGVVFVSLLTNIITIGLWLPNLQVQWTGNNMTIECSIQSNHIQYSYFKKIRIFQIELQVCWLLENWFLKNILDAIQKI